MTTVSKSCVSWISDRSADSTSARRVASGKLAQSIWSRPSSVGMKIGVGAAAAVVDLPMPSVP